MDLRKTLNFYLQLSDNSFFITNKSDAGQTIHASDRVFNQKMYEAAKVLNIKRNKMNN